MPEIRCYQVDAFTDRPFAGNPAAVCLLTEPLEESLMQLIAAEMNLSETAFVEPLASGYGLRWFTPVVEVALCGHATLASAHILWSEGFVDHQEVIEFHTKSGLLTAKRDGKQIQLDFPSQAVKAAAEPVGFTEALGAKPTYFGMTRDDAFVVVDSEAKLRALAPNFVQLAELPVRGAIVTSRSNEPQYDFVSRFFAPRCGIDEDPVTGSAHCSLGPYWATILSKQDLVAFQASQRGGELQVGMRGDRVLLGGQAVTVLSGELKIPQEVNASE